MAWDYEKLSKLSAMDRHRLWENASRLAPKNEDARNLCDLIESSGLDYLADKTCSVALDDPIGKVMRRIIFSE